jgi:hypothetical protein
MEEELFLSKSCETYVLDNELLISAYPAFIVFGKTEGNKCYKKHSFFKFSSFQITELLKTILLIFEFFSNQTVNEKTEKIIDISSNLTYYWQGVQILKNETLSKIVKFAIELEKETIFHVTFTIQEINTFVYLIQRCLLASLCLKDIEEDFILNVIKLTKLEIRASKTDDTCALKVVNKFFSEKHLCRETKQRSFIEILRYYNQILLVLKDLNDLHFFDNE